MHPAHQAASRRTSTPSLSPATHPNAKPAPRHSPGTPRARHVLESHHAPTRSCVTCTSTIRQHQVTPVPRPHPITRSRRITPPRTQKARNESSSRAFKPSFNAKAAFTQTKPGRLRRLPPRMHSMPPNRRKQGNLPWGCPCAGPLRRTSR